MMPGMAPPGPPTAYLPGPFMQPMPYPPGMPSPGLSTVKQKIRLRLMLFFLAQLCTLLVWDKCRVSLKLQAEYLILKVLLAPQAYMPPPPPPGAYPPPPNGAGPRPSMPPTPIPAHAHPYYHQSPQSM